MFDLTRNNSGIDRAHIKVKLAVLITCHNRKMTTHSCLTKLYSQAWPLKQITVYLVDDGCTDGTGEMVSTVFPEVVVIQGSGSLFWAGGMRAAMNAALEHGYDYYLWLNDDTMLVDSAVSQLIETARRVESGSGPSIIVGSVCDPQSEELSYGGFASTKRSLDLRLLHPTGDDLACDTFNGNCVLISQPVVDVLGNISTEFSHSMGDIDYGMRAAKMGIRSWVAPGMVGTCEPNRNKHNWANPKLSLRERLQSLNSPTGLPPIEFARLARRHTGWLWPWYVLKLYFRVLAPRYYEIFKSKNLRKLSGT